MEIATIEIEQHLKSGLIASVFNVHSNYTRIPPLVLESHGAALDESNERVEAFNKRFAGTETSQAVVAAPATPAGSAGGDRTACNPVFGTESGESPIDPLQSYTFPADRVVPLATLESDHEQLAVNLGLGFLLGQRRGWKC